MNTNNAAVIVSATPSDELADRIKEWLREGHHLASLLPGDKKDIVAFEKCGGDEYVTVCEQLLKGHRRYRDAKKEEKVRAFRTGCAAVVTSARGEEKSYREEVACMSPTARAKAEKSFQSTLRIPTSDFADVFNGAQVERINSGLKDLGYKVVKSEDGKSWDVLIAFEPKVESKEDKDARVGVVRKTG